ncbi:hypothetical protein BP6252_02726 [Coleophoma cylindrospora]|uniref:GCN5-related N-acetyltransferase Rv2170-like domain-containing protein n=1 Tax=Coleophoma cylindrospora TaxID=1849047 RepID=A0A3D8SFT0_9HELO|nr:hypothetical protein BP6252_02726 [Coleophoma cylindrospora]
MSEQKPLQRAVVRHDKESLPQAISLYSSAFKDDPVITYMLNNFTEEARLAYLPSYFRAILTAAALNKAIIADVADWQCCGFLMPPGEKVDNPMTWKTLFEYTPVSDKAKVKALGKSKYYYVFFIGTSADSRKQGLASIVIKDFQAQAAAEKLPVWLEATTTYSRDLYEKLGFQVVEEMVIGQGTCSPDGLPSRGGPGVPIWGMIWRPQS